MDHLEFPKSLRDAGSSGLSSHRKKILDVCIQIETMSEAPSTTIENALRRLKNLQKSSERVSDDDLRQHLRPMSYFGYVNLSQLDPAKKKLASRPRQRENRKLGAANHPPQGAMKTASVRKIFSETAAAVSSSPVRRRHERG